MIHGHTILIKALFLSFQKFQRPRTEKKHNIKNTQIVNMKSSSQIKSYF